MMRLFAMLAVALSSCAGVNCATTKRTHPCEYYLGAIRSDDRTVKCWCRSQVGGDNYREVPVAWCTAPGNNL